MQAPTSKSGWLSGTQGLFRSEPARSVVVPPPPPVPGQRAATAWGGEPRRPGPAGWLAETGAVLVMALRLLIRHWPVLLALYLAGVLVREVAMRVAVRASLLNAELGLLVLLLAPMATLVSLVLMLRTLRPSLPTLGASGPPPPVLEHLGSVLVPFLTIYYFEDWLRDDGLDYAARITYDDVGRQFAQFGAADQEVIDTAARLPYDLTVTMVAVVATAIVARWLLSRWRATQRYPWLGIPGAYLELVWVTLVYFAFLAVSEHLVAWGGQRRLVQATQTGWDDAVGALAGLASPAQSVTAWFTDQLGHLNAVLVVPLAWLAIGAVVLGRPPQLLAELVGRTDRGRDLHGRLHRWWAATPRPLRWTLVKLTVDLRGRFTPLAHGIRMLIRGGVAAMLLFCLAFVVVRAVEDWLWQAQRALIGPQDLWEVWLPLSGPLFTVNRTVTYVLLVCLLAAAVDRAAAQSAPAHGSRT